MKFYEFHLKVFNICVIIYYINKIKNSPSYTGIYIKLLLIKYFLMLVYYIIFFKETFYILISNQKHDRHNFYYIGIKIVSSIIF